MVVRNIKGEMFGHIRVLYRTTSKVHSYRCVCEAPGCGKRLTIRRDRLVHNRPKEHCGCLKGVTREQGGLCGRNPREYRVWRMMKVRCSDPRHTGYPAYGGRGIKVCDRWLDKKTGFESFLKDMGKRPITKKQPKGLTLDRIDPDGNYEPTNCRWATWKQQANNKRSK